MAFFENQARARRSTLLLVFLFLTAVVLIIVTLNFVIIGGIILVEENYPSESEQKAAYKKTSSKYYVITPEAEDNDVAVSGNQAGQSAQPVRQRWWRPKISLIIASVTLAVIFLGSLIRIISLGNGGSAVAEMLGCRKISPDTRDPGERRLINVVEEMSIASGIPVPGIYMMDEDSINAFAAGLNTSSAVVSVTRGAVQKLNREELQGVVAHEFSHILNSDMKLNIRLMGILYGILLIAMIGYGVVRIVGTSRIDTKDKGAAVIIAVFVIGVIMMILGYIGMFFGQLIQCAVSRQREYLADASAVQFTRNSAGIVGALKKIGGLADGSKISTHKAREAAHLFFGDAISRLSGSLLATHPPLEKRIKAIDPTFNGQFPAVQNVAADDFQADMTPLQQKVVRAVAAQADFAKSRENSPIGDNSIRFLGALSQLSKKEGGIKVKPAEITGRMGVLTNQQVAYATNVKARMPAEIAQAIHTSAGAQAVMICLLLEKEGSLRASQLANISGQLDQAVCEQTANLCPQVDLMPQEIRLPAVSMAMPALRELDGPTADKFKTALKYVIESDKQVTIFEYLLYRIVCQAFLSAKESSRADKAKYFSITPLWPGATAILSAIAFSGGKDQAAAAQAFGAGIKWLSGDAVMAAPVMPTLDQLDQGLNLWAQAAAGLKNRFIKACTECAAADGVIQVEEAELLRAVACVLHCPMPPILETAA